MKGNSSSSSSCPRGGWRQAVNNLHTFFASGHYRVTRDKRCSAHDDDGDARNSAGNGDKRQQQRHRDDVVSAVAVAVDAEACHCQHHHDGSDIVADQIKIV